MPHLKTLLPDLRNLVRQLFEDLLARSTGDNQIDAGLRQAFQQIEKGGRTAQAFEVWREDYLDQVAVAWVLACVFVRFLEDNHLIDQCWLAGEGQRRKLAEDTHELFFRAHPHDTDREYFQHVFREVGKIPAARDLFTEGKTPLWAVDISGDAAMSLLKFWQEQVEDMDNPPLKRSFEVENGDTRFLGDLYQELSERAKKKYALLQTPVFVEEFILDRTLTPAINAFGLDTVRMIDPTCGSGHFLLGGFARLFREWSEPGHTTGNDRTDVQKALDGVWGVDINPFAVAIARFRLVVAAAQACRIHRLKDAPGWKIHLATGDSLLFGHRWSREGERIHEQKWLASDEESWAPEIYACEDKETVQEILGQQYHAVVGNPPYIVVRDSKLNAAYRERFPTVCYRQYSLAAPFAERFFDLCWTKGNGQSGYVGMITANSFMKREFGKKLIEEFFPKVDLTHVLDTSGAYIPGHGTPTVILFGRNRKPNGDAVRAVLGIKGEPSTPEDPAQGQVWQSIISQVDKANAQDDFTSTADVPRTTFNCHPWSIGGGGAAELKEQIESECEQVLEDVLEEIGFGAVTREDDVYLVSRAVAVRNSVPTQHVRPLVSGEEVRDWSISNPIEALFPYDPVTLASMQIPAIDKLLWPWKTQLRIRIAYGLSQLERGLRWSEYSMLFANKLRTPLSIAFAEIASHNHFVLDRGGKVFNRTAPIIKLSPNATEDEHLALLGLLNSSTACFWLKQVCHNKGSTVDQHGARQRTSPFEDFYQHNGTRVGQFPIPENKPFELGRRLDRLAEQYVNCLPASTVGAAKPTAQCLADARQQADSVRRQMIALQEELDWQCYQLYGLLAEDLCCHGDDLPELKLGERAFEIVVARQMAKGELETTWFERHGSTPITEIPTHWPEAYQKLVARRIEVIQTNQEIGLIEKPEYKRRWNTEPWEEQEQRALRGWLLDRLESRRYWPDPKSDPPTFQTTAQLADKASCDHEFMEVAALYRGRADFDLSALVAELVSDESVPFLPMLRYKPSGSRKREVWERTWALQRKEDAGEEVGAIPVPPKYITGDFLKTDYWRLRGKLDVPKERWVSYPHCSAESDPSLLVGWAGWNHLEQATAIIHYYDARKREGWDAKRLTPLLAGLDQLLPWIHQWHAEIDPEFGETAGQSYQTMLEQDAHELGLTLEEIRNWQPPQGKKGGGRKTKR
jgi:hypothetical protein